MRKTSLLLILLLAAAIAAIFYYSRKSSVKNNKTKTPAAAFAIIKKDDHQLKKLQQKAKELKLFAKKNNYETSVYFLVDMSVHSGKFRFYIYDANADTVKATGLVAHGSCNTKYLAEPVFNNTIGCGCSALGRYRISYAYKGQFGNAYKLIGLDSTNNNAFARNVVLHAWDYPKDEEVYPEYTCNSLGCPMVSYAFLNKLSAEIKKAKRPVLLWMFN